MKRRKRKLVIHDLSEDEGQYRKDETQENDVFLDIALKCTGRLIYFLFLAVLFVLASLAVVVLMNDTTRNALLQLLNNIKL